MNFRLRLDFFVEKKELYQTKGAEAIQTRRLNNNIAYVVYLT